LQDGHHQLLSVPLAAGVELEDVFDPGLRFTGLELELPQGLDCVADVAGRAVGLDRARELSLRPWSFARANSPSARGAFARANSPLRSACSTANASV